MFLVTEISSGSVKIAGNAVAIHWIVKSIIRLPVAYFLDKKRGEHDDFYSLILGFFIMSICYFLYLFAKTPNHIYIIQILMGFSAAFAFTPWYVFFSRHIDKHHENFEWSIANSSIGFGLAGAGFTTGFIVDKFGFTPIFIISGVLCFLGTLLLLLIGKNLKVEKPDGLTIKIK